MAMDPEVKALNACIRELDKLEDAGARARLTVFLFARYNAGEVDETDPIERMWRSKKLRHAFLRALSSMPLGPIGEPGCKCYVDERGLRSTPCPLHADEIDDEEPTTTTGEFRQDAKQGMLPVDQGRNSGPPTAPPGAVDDDTEIDLEEV